MLLKLISDLRVFPHDDLKYTPFTPYICVFDGWKVFEKSVLKLDAPTWKEKNGHINKGKCRYMYVNIPIPWSIWVMIGRLISFIWKDPWDDCMFTYILP